MQKLSYRFRGEREWQNTLNKANKLISLLAYKPVLSRHFVKSQIEPHIIPIKWTWTPKLANKDTKKLC